MSDERDPGDEDELAWPHFRCTYQRWTRGITSETELALERDRRKRDEPRAAALRDIDSTWRRTGRR